MERRIDAVFQRKTNKKVYFFEGEKYYRYTPGKKVDKGYPKKIKGIWKRFPDRFTKDLDAAFYRPDNGKEYFFKGDEYIRHTPGSGMDANYPKKIKGIWKRFPEKFTNNIDAATYSIEREKEYFFKGEEYIRHTPGKGMDRGYPKLIGGDYWDGVFNIYSKDTVRKILEKKLKNKLSSDYKIHLGDVRYYFLGIEEATQIINDTSVEVFKWTSEKFDCDDFAYVLKAEFCKKAYYNKKRRSPYCVGILWGHLPSPHAINWMINDDHVLRFIEPQNDSIFRPRRSDKKIWMIIA